MLLGGGRGGCGVRILLLAALHEPTLLRATVYSQIVIPYPCIMLVFLVRSMPAIKHYSGVGDSTAVLFTPPPQQGTYLVH